jgi:copper(I)-binding protein
MQQAPHPAKKVRAMRTVLAVLISLGSTFVLSACEQKPLYVDQAYIRLSPNPQSPSAGYFTVHASAQPVTLRDVITDAAVRVEMHDNMMHGGMMTMKPVDHVDIPAKAVVRFEPGGRHLMLWNVNPAVAATGKITLTFLFSNGDRILVDAAVQKPGDAPPAPKVDQGSPG